MRVVPVRHRSIDDYRGVVGNEVVNALQRHAWGMSGHSVLHINSTAYGGGVAEVLLAHIPLLRDPEIEARWAVIDGDERFFGITKSIHNAIQGERELEWTAEMEEHYTAVVRSNLDSLPEGYDVVVVHDPQPLAIPKLLGDDRSRVGRRWVWRCHIDSSDPNPEVWSFVARHLDVYDAVVFTADEFVQPEVPVERVVVSPPSIDPMSPKNADLADVTVHDICTQYGIDMQRPLIAQVSRFDPWKDPFGVIAAYQLVKEQVPDVQLILAGSLAHDDPEGLKIYEDVMTYREKDPDVAVLSNLQEVGNTSVNCFQRAAQVVIQKSLKEGFGLTVAEAAWKGKPVIGGRAGGIKLQIVDGETGYLVDSVEACAQRTLELLADPERSARMGSQARELIRSRYLTTRELGDWLELFASVNGG